MNDEVIQQKNAMLDTLTTAILLWAWERNLVNGANPASQAVKLMEEVGELAGGICKNKADVIKDSIGDAFVVLVIIAAQMGWSMAECVEAAYNEIKERKGKMVNGVFVKGEV